jgi:transcriptional regulator with XRE-family HTH domain
MKFGQKLRKLREEKGMSQHELAKRLGYQTNSYVSDMEQGKFIPSLEKLKKIAKVLGVPFSKLKSFVVESRLEEMGIRDPAFLSLARDYPRLNKENKKAIFDTYLKAMRQEIAKKGKLV